MDLSQYVNQLREDLAAAAAAGDDQTRQIAALLGAAVEPAARLAIMNALADLAAEVTAALGDRVVEVRLDGRDIRVAVSGEPAAEPATEPEPEPAASGAFRGFGGDSGDISRITLRLVEQIKGQAEQAAAAKGMSLNSWVAQAVQGALSGGGPPGKGRPGEGGGRGGRRRRPRTAGACRAGCRDERARERAGRTARAGRADGDERGAGPVKGPVARRRAGAGSPAELAGGRGRRAGAVGRPRPHPGAAGRARRRRRGRSRQRPGGAGRGAARPVRRRHLEPGPERAAELAGRAAGRRRSGWRAGRRSGRRARTAGRAGGAGHRDQLDRNRAAAGRALPRRAAAAGRPAGHHGRRPRPGHGWPRGPAAATSG